MKPKHIFLFLFLSLALMFGVPALFSFTGNADAGAAFEPAASPVYEVYFTNGTTANTVGTDTLTNTESDTFYVPPLLLSNWYYNVTLRATAQTGTRSVITRLEESNERSGTAATYWYEVERDTAKTGTTTLRLNSDHSSVDEALQGRVQGVRQRVILTGTGTQHTTYTLKLTYKKD